MKLRMKLVLGLAVLSLGAIPAVGMADGPTYTPEGPSYQPEHPAHPPTPKGKAYGFHCKGESKKHVKGQKGTPFSTCVKGVAQMREEQAATLSTSSAA